MSTFIVSLQHADLKCSTIRSYSSAITSKNQLLGFSVSDQVQLQLDQLFRGIENVATETQGPARVRPAMSSVDILQLCSVLDSMEWSATTRELTSMYAAVIFGFLFALRASSLVAVRHCDIILQSDKLGFNEIKRKSKSPQTTRSAYAPLQSCVPARTLHKYLTWLLSQHIVPSQSVFGFTSVGSPHRLVGVAIELASNVFAAEPTDKLTSHCLRRGAAVAMFALGVPIQRILSWGAWASEDSVRPYIKDRAWSAASDADKLCFAWML